MARRLRHERETPGALEVFRNRPFLLLWLSQLFTQIGGNMVLFGLTVIVVGLDQLHDGEQRPDPLLPGARRGLLGRCRRLRGPVRQASRPGRHERAAGPLSVALWAVGANLLLLVLFNALISTVTVFFAPAEAAMIPQVVPRRQLLSANGVFTLTLNAAFAIGFALLGPLVVRLLGAPALILVVGVCYLVAAGFCWTLPPAPPAADRW